MFRCSVGSLNAAGVVADDKDLGNVKGGTTSQERSPVGILFGIFDQQRDLSRCRSVIFVGSIVAVAIGVGRFHGLDRWCVVTS